MYFNNPEEFFARGFPLRPPLPMLFKTVSGVFKLSLLIVVFAIMSPSKFISFDRSIITSICSNERSGEIFRKIGFDFINFFLSNWRDVRI